MMIKNSKYLIRLVCLLSFILSSQVAYAQPLRPGSGSSGNNNDADEEPDPPSVPGSPSGNNNDADVEPDVPIDMYTSALLVVGIGLVANYAYFANRRRENV